MSMQAVESAGPAPSPLTGLNRWTLAAFGVAGVVLVPVLLVLGLALKSGTQGGFIEIGGGILAGALLETGLLLAGVAALTAVMGVATAWLVVHFNFPGRRWLSWALILPFAVPTYISAYAWVEMFDYFGPVQGAVRQIFGFRSRSDYWFPDLRSMGGAVTITALVLYPYIYVAARAAFAVQGSSLDEAARGLGCGRFEALRRVVLPVIWPAIAAGMTLVVLETINDIGASQYLGVRTLTVAIYDLWLNRSSLGGAAKLALVILAIVLATLWLERWLRRDRRFSPTTRCDRPVARQTLKGWQAGLAMGACALPVMLGFGVPGLVLVSASTRQWRTEGWDSALGSALGYTVLSATLATALILVAATVVVLAQRMAKDALATGAVRLSAIGYAVPGTVLVIGLLPALGSLDGWINDVSLGLGGPRVGLVLSASLFAIVLAYAIRFLAIGIDQAQAALAGISPNTDAAARTLGCTRRELTWQILLPAMRPAMVGAAILIFVDCLKELPATLLLRPLNVETLATYLYGFAARGSFEDGAPAALMIMLAGMLPLLSLDRMIEGHGRGKI